MPRQFPFALAASRTAARVLVALNAVLAFLILVLLVASVLARTVVFTGLGADPTDGRMVASMRLIMVCGLLSAPLAHALLTRLLAIVESVRAGDPFVAVNAERLQITAWALLGLEVLHLAVGALAAYGSSSSHPLDIGWDLSVTGWLGVLLLFVLARVFEHGTRLRDDLAGTV